MIKAGYFLHILPYFSQCDVVRLSERDCDCDKIEMKCRRKKGSTSRSCSQCRQCMELLNFKKSWPHVLPRR